MGSDLRSGRRLLMCPPTHFDVSYAINPWMDPTVAVDRQLATRQWEALAASCREAGATVELLDPQPGLPDLVFTANLGLVDGGTFIPARMRHAERRGEAVHAERWFRDHGCAIRRLGPDVVQEGAGDALPSAPRWSQATRARSNAAAYVELGRVVAGELLLVELADPRFYHVDMVFCPLDARTAMVATGALDAEGGPADRRARARRDRADRRRGGGLLRERDRDRPHRRHGRPARRGSSGSCARAGSSPSSSTSPSSSRPAAGRAA